MSERRPPPRSSSGDTVRAAGERRPTPRSGFALLSVLFGLLVITALFAVASKTGVSHAQGMATEREVLLVRGAAAERADLALRLLADAPVAGPQASGAPDIASNALTALGLVARDVGGRIDLNTGAPALVRRVLSGPDMPPGAFEAFTDWRRQDRRLQRVEDLTWIAGLTPDQAARVSRVATVHSGRRGVAPDAAPPEVLDLFGPGGAPPEMRTALTGVTFDLLETGAPGEAPRLLATITLGTGEDGGRILALP